MERKICLTGVLLFVFGFMSIYASHKAEIYKAYISNNMSLWKKTMDAMNQQNGKSNDGRLELLNYQYGYIGWCMGNKQHKVAERYIELGEKNMEMLEKTGSYASIINAYKSAFYGFKVALNLFKAPFIGPKSIECAKLSIRQDPQNPYGYIQYANSQFYMPSVFGGSKKVALDNYMKAERLMERNRQGVAGDWNYLSLLSMIATTYVELKEFNQAKLYYEKILRIEPDFLWVKEELYPDLLRRLN